ncbi:hypothetical protein [Streptomyces sp. NPDC056672]|uniref:hypothetical protein n=1 Tax=Streptomyces sp. NPDC056672 TaxID=3345906 RepID=UPI00367F7D66
MIVRFPFPPWGGRVSFGKPVCVRARKDGRPCVRQAAEWPEGYVDVADPGACPSHQTPAERDSCLRARKLYRAAFWELKAAHRDAAGHGRDETCTDCCPAGQPGTAF